MFGDPVSNPKGWKVVDFKDVCIRTTVGIVVKPASYYVENGIPALRSLNIKRNEIKQDNFVYVSRYDNDTKLSKTQVHTNDIVIVRTGQPGTAAIIPSELDGANAIDILIATPDLSKVHPIYLSFFLNSTGGKKIVTASKRGQIQQHFNLKFLNSSSIILPDVKQQLEFVSIYNHIKEIEENYTNSLTNNESLFSTLQQQAFRGDL